MKHSTPPGLRHLDGALRDLDGRGLLRRRPEPIAPVAKSFCSNDYLGLAGRLVDPAPAGAGASRLVAGENDEHLRLEAALRGWLGVESALTFTSGYAANLGTVSALAGPEDVIVSDVLNHASIIDGARLSRAEVVVVPHLNVAAVATALARTRGRRAWVVTESYFSMDADSPDLPALRAVCDAAGAALVVDEAHALGVFGPDGRGLCAEAGVVPDVVIGTMGKSFGAGGAFVAGCAALTAWLWNRARSFVFSTGLSPAVAAAARVGLETSIAHPELRRSVLARSAQLRDGLIALGVDVRGHGPIVPVILGDPRRAVQVAASARAAGIHVQAIRPPSVPEGTARLRLTTTAAHTEDDVTRALRALGDALSCPSS